MAWANISMPSKGLAFWGVSSCKHSAANCIDDDIEDHIESSIDATTVRYYIIYILVATLLIKNLSIPCYHLHFGTPSISGSVFVNYVAITFEKIIKFNFVLFLYFFIRVQTNVCCRNK